MEGRREGSTHARQKFYIGGNVDLYGGCRRVQHEGNGGCRGKGGVGGLEGGGHEEGGLSNRAKCSARSLAHNSVRTLYIFFRN